MIHKSKLVVVGILLVGGVIFGLRDWEGITYGMKAATLTIEVDPGNWTGS